MKNNFKNNLKNLLIISEIIHNKIANSKLKKKHFYNKYDKIKGNKEIIISGLISGSDIKKNIYLSPYDKPIKLDFKLQIDLDDVFLEQNKTINFFNDTNKLDINILVKNINKYIGVVKDFKPNIYQEYLFTIDEKNSDEIIFNNENKFQIIIWNLELKKYLCLLWKLMEKLYLEFNIYKKNNSVQIKKEILDIIQQELFNISNNINIFLNNFEIEINSLIILLLSIKNIFDLADDEKYLLSFNKIDILFEKYLFVINFIINNLTIITN